MAIAPPSKTLFGTQIISPFTPDLTLAAPPIPQNPNPTQPTVITSAPAANQAKIQADGIQQMDQIIALNQQAKNEAAAKPAETPKQELITVYNPNGGSSDNSMQVDKNNLGIWNAAGWTTVKPTTPTGAAESGTGTTGTGTTTPPAPTAPPSNASFIAQQLEANQTKAAEAQKAFQASIDQIRNGTFPLTPDQQAQLDGITNSYAALIEEQRLANQNFTMATTQAGISGGRNIYAPEMELGNIKGTVDQGIKKIAGLQSQMLAEVAKAKQAIMDNNVKLLDASYKSLTDLQTKQHQEIMDLNTLTQQEIENARADHAAALDDARFAFDVEKEKNKPLLEADKRLQDYIADQVAKYPDAGVTEADTFASASAKIMASKSWKEEQAKLASETAKNLQSGSTSDSNELLTPTDAAKLGVPYGTTKGQAAAMGIKPSGEFTTKQSADYTNITNKFNGDADLRVINRMSPVAAIADQVIADPSKATNQLKTLYLLVKALDPNSAVKEGEIQLAQDTSSLLQKWEMNIQRITEGKIVPDNVAKELAQASKDVVAAWGPLADKRVSGYRAQAKGLGILPEIDDFIVSSGYQISSKDLSERFGVPASDIDEAVKVNGFETTYNFLRDSKKA